MSSLGDYLSDIKFSKKGGDENEYIICVDDVVSPNRCKSKLKTEEVAKLAVDQGIFKNIDLK